MRITDSQMIAQLTKTLTNEGNQASPAAKVGDVLNAIVADILEEGLLLNVGGQLIKASVRSPQNFSLQDQVFLKVIQSDAQQILVERVSPEEVAAGEQQKTADGLGEALKALDLSNTPKNQSLLEALNAFKNPINTTTVKQLQVQLSALETVLNDLPEAMKLDMPAKDFQSMPLRDLAIAVDKAIAQQGNTVLEVAADKTSAPAQTASNADLEQKQMPEAVSNTKSNLTPVTSETSIDIEIVEVKAQGQTSLPEMKTGEVQKSVLPEIGSKIEVPTDKKQLQDIIEGLQGLKDPKTAQKALSFLMKMEIQATPQSLFATEQIFNRTQLKTFLNDLIKLDDNQVKMQISDKDLSALRDILKGFQPETFKSQEEVQQMVKKLVEALKTLEEAGSKPGVQSPDLTLANKAVTETMRSTQLPFVLSQFPLFINDRLETLELYVEKRHKGKSIDPEDTRIYLALTTEKLGQIGAMIEVYHRAITVTLDTTQAEVQTYLDLHLDEMKESLEALGYVMTVKTELKAKATKLQDLHEHFEPIQFTRFDKKV